MVWSKFYYFNIIRHFPAIFNFMALSKTPQTVSPKTVELIIYISYKLKDRPNYGSILLGKALCLIDSMSYFKTGFPITDLTYIKQEKGPTPHPAKFLSIRDELVSKGELEKIDTPFYGRAQKKYVAKREPKTDIFTPDEIFLIDEVLESISNMNATDISELTHQFVSWKVASDKEELPFYTFLLTQAEPSSADFEWATNVMKKYLSNQDGA